MVFLKENLYVFLTSNTILTFINSGFLPPLSLKRLYVSAQSWVNSPKEVLSDIGVVFPPTGQAGCVLVSVVVTDTVIVLLPLCCRWALLTDRHSYTTCTSFKGNLSSLESKCLNCINQRPACVVSWPLPVIDCHRLLWVSAFHCLILNEDRHKERKNRFYLCPELLVVRLQSDSTFLWEYQHHRVISTINVLYLACTRLWWSWAYKSMNICIS